MLHAKEIDPVINEITRIIKILHNQDGSWGIDDDEFSRVFPTAWILKTELDHDDYKKGINFIINIIKQNKYVFNKKFINENFLKGFYLSFELILKEENINKTKLITFSGSISQIMNFLMKDIKISNKV